MTGMFPIKETTKQGCRGFIAIVFYLTYFILGVTECNEKDDELCFKKSCSNVCTNWWLIIIGAVGLFRVLFLSLLIVWTNILYKENTYHSNVLYMWNYFLGFFEKFLFNFEFFFIFYIASQSDNFIQILTYASFLILQILYRTVRAISKCLICSKEQSNIKESALNNV
jgi:hypothetical protein